MRRKNFTEARTRERIRERLSDVFKAPHLVEIVMAFCGPGVQIEVFLDYESRRKNKKKRRQGRAPTRFRAAVWSIGEDLPTTILDLALARQNYFVDRKDLAVFGPTGQELQRELIADNLVETYAAGGLLRSVVRSAPFKTDRVVRVVVLGEGAVGKSSVTLRYTNDHFQEEYDPTIEDAYRCSRKYDGTFCTLDVLDTAGAEDFTALRGAWYRGKDVVLLVCSVGPGQRGSIDVLKEFYEQLCDFYEDDPESRPEIVILGNKCDLVGPEERAEILENIRDKTVRKWGLPEDSPVLLTSAKTGENVVEAFVEGIRRFRGSAEKDERPKKYRHKPCVLM